MFAYADVCAIVYSSHNTYAKMCKLLCIDHSSVTSHHIRANYSFTRL